MITLGQRLRQARESRGIDLSEVATATKVTSSYLEAIEADDFDSLPGDVFARGFVRAFAAHVGLDPEVAIQEYRLARGGTIGTHQDPPDEVVPEMARLLGADRQRDRRDRQRRWVAVLAVTVVALGVLSLTVFMMWRSEPQTSASRVAAPPPAPAEVAHREVEPARIPESRPVVTRELPTDRVVPADTDDHPAVAEEPREAVIEDRAVPTEGDDHRGGMAVSRFGVGTGVRDRALIGEGDRFPEGTAVWFWTLVEGGSRGDSIDHVWLHDGVEVQRVRLKVDASSWRTQSHKSLSDCRGAWTVEARDAAGGVLARSAFSCSA